MFVSHIKIIYDLFLQYCVCVRNRTVQLFICLSNNLFKLGKFTKIQYTYVNKKIARQIG